MRSTCSNAESTRGVVAGALVKAIEAHVMAHEFASWNVNEVLDPEAPAGAAAARPEQVAVVELIAGQAVPVCVVADPVAEHEPAGADDEAWWSSSQRNCGRRRAHSGPARRRRNCG